uniref:Si:dkey-224e22.2 n=1 Tax=Labrus bergylta TaxID=56723 RepID=A0A3Q3G9E0_9LABR
MSSMEGLRANSSQFTLERKPFRILGGSIHYFRVPRAYWEDRLLKMKACGLNTLTRKYVPWNLHEPERGTFRFQDQLDLKAFVTLAADMGLWVILRPGPYICAEWELGGLPSWLLQDKGMQLRTTYPGFVNAVGLYFDKLVSIIKPLMVKGGPVIAVQVENEYGSYAKDDKYMPFIKNVSPQKPLMVMEYWSGWFDVWESITTSVVSEILERGVSINLYMFHGGQLWLHEWSDGLRYLQTPNYNAPLSEAGDCTPKYQLLRKLFSQYHPEPLPEVPSPQERRAYDPVLIQQHLSLWDSLHFTDKPFRSDRPSYGYTLYETTITCGETLNSGNNIRDRALVFVDRRYVGTLDYKTQELILPKGQGERTLSLLVENCGRVNYGKALDEQRKGILGDILLNHTPLRGFNIFCLDMKPGFMKSSGSWKSDIEVPSLPGFFLARLHVDGPPKDTFIRLPGAVFVNGQNLGRHWFIGPQHFLYLPGPWLRRGENQMIVFEEQKVDDKILFAENPEHGRTTDVYKLPFCTLL